MPCTCPGNLQVPEYCSLLHCNLQLTFFREHMVAKQQIASASLAAVLRPLCTS